MTQVLYCHVYLYGRIHRISAPIFSPGCITLTPTTKGWTSMHHTILGPYYYMPWVYISCHPEASNHRWVHHDWIWWDGGGGENIPIPMEEYCRCRCSCRANIGIIGNCNWLNKGCGSRHTTLYELFSSGTGEAPMRAIRS